MDSEAGRQSETRDQAKKRCGEFNEEKNSKNSLDSKDSKEASDGDGDKIGERRHRARADQF